MHPQQHDRAADLLVLVVLLAVLPSDAHAYIDPGSGALVVQLALSAFAGAVFMARRMIGRAWRAMGRKRGSSVTARQAPGSDSSGRVG